MMYLYYIKLCDKKSRWLQLLEQFNHSETLTFNVFVPNQQDGIELDYETGDHELLK